MNNIIDKYQLKPFFNANNEIKGYNMPNLSLSLSSLDIDKEKPYIFYLNNKQIKSFNSLELAKKYISRFKRKMNKEVKNLVMGALI